MKFRAASLLLIITILCAAASAQFPLTSGSISGSVQGGDGKPLPNVRVEVFSLRTGQMVNAAYTNVAGSFEIGDLPSGDYDVIAQQGISEVRERVTVHSGGAIISLRLAGEGAAVADAGGQHSVSVVQLKVSGKARRYLKKAEKALREREYEKAEEYVGKALSEYADFPDALVLRGVLAMDENRLDAAMQDFQKAIEIDASCTMGFVAMAAAFNMKGDFDGALRSLERALVLLPNNWQAHFEMGKAQIGKADYRKALQALDRAAQFAPEPYGAIHLAKAHALLGLKNYPEAMFELQAYIDREPEGAGAQNARDTLEKVKAFAAKQ